MNDLPYYLGLFGKLHRFRGLAPHKPILLLAVLDEIERGNIPTNLIELTPELVASFRAYWRTLVLEKGFVERIANPFRFLVQDGFWTLVRGGIAVPTSELGDNPTLRQLTTEIDGAQLAPDLWNLLRDETSRNALRAHLLKTYFGISVADLAISLPANPLEDAIERLKLEAQAKFRTNVVKEAANETGYYLRHSLFPRVVKSLYLDSCAVCDLNVKTDTGSGLVDAAHILPFHLFHNDDPRNGLALCKNHHWGFDAGWYSFDSQRRVIVSSRLQNWLGFVSVNAPLRPTTDPDCAPALNALEWHRTHVFKR